MMLLHFLHAFNVDANIKKSFGQNAGAPRRKYVAIISIIVVISRIKRADLQFRILCSEIGIGVHQRGRYCIDHDVMQSLLVFLEEHFREPPVPSPNLTYGQSLSWIRQEYRNQTAIKNTSQICFAPPIWFS